MINTGDERNVVGHFISGAVFSAMFATAINYNKYKKSEISKNEMMKNTCKLTLQGGLGTASAIATANYIGKGNYIGAMTAMSLGIAGLYATEKAHEMYGEGFMGKGTKPTMEKDTSTVKKTTATAHKAELSTEAVKKPTTRKTAVKKTEIKAKEGVNNE